MKLRALVELFYQYNQHNRKARTLEFYQGQLGKILDRLGDVEAQDLRPFHVLDFKPTWHLILAIQRLFHWAVEEMDLLQTNPMIKLKRPRLNSRRRVLSPHELARLLRGSASDFRRFLVAARESAARPQELRTLSWDDLHWQGDQAALKEQFVKGEAYFLLTEYKGRSRRNDTEAPRIIPVSPRLGRLLWRLLCRRAEEGVIFKTDSGKAWNRDMLRSRMHRLRLRVDIPLSLHGEKVCCYTMRHTAATNLAAQGLQTSTLREFLGHSNIRTTQRYVHLQREAMMLTWKRFWEQRRRGPVSE